MFQLYRPSGKEAADHRKSKSTKTWSKKPPPHNTQETAGHQPGKTSLPTEEHAKAGYTAERNENKDKDILDASKQGQWPGYLIFFGYLVLIGVLIVMLYHVLYVRSLSTISNETVKFVVKGYLEEHYGPIFKLMMEEEEKKFRSSYLNPLETEITKINDQVKKLDTDTQKVDSLIKEAEETFKNLTSQQVNIQIGIDDFRTDLEVVENNFKTVKGAQDEQVKQMNSTFEELKNSLKLLDKRNSEIEGQSEAIASKLQQVTTDQQKINDKHDLQKQKFTALIQHIENTKNILNKKLKITGAKVTSWASSVSALDSRLSQTQNLTVAVGSLQAKYEEKIEPNLFNKGYFMIAFMLLFVLVLILMVSHYRLYQRFEDAEHGNRFQNKPKRSSVDILSQVPSKPQLQAAVCIISFDEGRQAAHQQLLDSANLPNCRVVTFLVRRHSNIPDLPKCKVYLMCTEFSERHVIIEEQGLGLGDLHRTTYDAVLKLGGQLIILYTRDPGSRRLKDNEVYNKGIYCVTHQEELVELNNLGRFFSVYDTLTTQQKTKLRQTIMDCLQ